MEDVIGPMEERKNQHVHKLVNNLSFLELSNTFRYIVAGLLNY
jgi:hypothetical protein